VLSTSGHIAALVNPPGNPKASFHTGDDLTSDAEVWLKGSDPQQGTWWTDLGPWLDQRGGGHRPAPTALGSPRLNVLAEAPGSYVFDD
jgi:polyhydroxyalkanoate synthase